MTSPNPIYAMRYATDKGRADAFDYLRKKARYALHARPDNPWPLDCAESAAWEAEFNRVVMEASK